MRVRSLARVVAAGTCVLACNALVGVSDDYRLAGSGGVGASAGAKAVGGAGTSRGGAAGEAEGGNPVAEGGRPADPLGTGGSLTPESGGAGEPGGPGSAAGAGGAGPEPVCDEGSAALPTGGCVPCGACVGPGLTGVVYPWTTQSGECVCRTIEGFFIDGALSSQPCDADNDGWTRISARASLESPDQALRENARCTLRSVQEIKLVNEAGQSLSLYFDPTGRNVTTTSVGGALPLYESVANDGGPRTSQQALPLYGTGASARSLAPAELNSFTKACVSSIADHNGNGLADVAEWAQLPDKQIATVPSDDPLSEYLPLYTRFSYFTELHTAAFTAPESRSGGIVGTYTITERKRTGAGSAAVVNVVGDPTSGSSYWRSCQRKRDAGYLDGSPAVTYDFASVSLPSASWSGMNHHSQFKCVVGVTSQVYSGFKSEAEHAAALQQQTFDSLSSRKWYANDCRLTDSVTLSGADATNPAAPKLDCSPSSALNTGDARWVAVSYDAVHGSPSYEYERGCIDECIDAPRSLAQCQKCDDGAWGQATATPIADGVSTDDCKAPLHCDGKGNCGQCNPSAVQCKDKATPQTCGSDRLWHDNAACAAGQECVAGGKCLKSDGQGCGNAAECASNVCTTFYKDLDNDGYPGDSQSFCKTPPTTDWKSSVSNPAKHDCCDGVGATFALVNPGQTTPSDKKGPCGNFDYNCDLSEKPTYPTMGSSGACTIGWAEDLSQPPKCGDQGNYIVGCTMNCAAEGSTCWSTPVVDTKTQTCL